MGNPFQFHPAVWSWFLEAFGAPTEPQEAGWPAIQSGRHTLIAAPTGSGKTLAAFLAALDRLYRKGLEGGLTAETEVLYISPLKALSNDIHKNLEIPLEGIRGALNRFGLGDVEVRAAVRTGDTSARERQLIGRIPPHILVTTPESFYLLLGSDSGRRMLRTVRTVIVDEIHAVAGNRRGTHLALSLERLAALTGRPLQRIGLSATQKPIDEAARFLVGNAFIDAARRTDCCVVDAGHRRAVDLAIEIPKSPLSAVMSNEVWEEVYGRLAEQIAAHRTTLIFVNTRRLAERLTLHLSERLGAEQVMSHHGSLSAELRLKAEHRLKRGELKALVATASLELGIDIGSVDLVCQIGSTRSLSTLMQRIGRAEHRRGGLPKGRLFPLTRDELVECIALVRGILDGELDRLEIPRKPLDILAQQIVAEVSVAEWAEDDLFALVQRAFMYGDLSRAEFESVLCMLAEGFSTQRGRRGALLHRDAVHGRVRARRGARLIALTSGGAIPDNADYRVLLEPSETFVGTVNEDFAVESMAGDIFQLGNASWRVVQVAAGVVRVQDASGQPPSIPFWLGEAPSRTPELSRLISELRDELQQRLETGVDCEAWLLRGPGISSEAARQVVEYYREVMRQLGVIPTERCIVMERFFDESGGMQLVIHSPFGSRINRAWGLALRKRFCRKFNFELQAAASEDAIVLSLGTQHSFPLEEVFRYLNSKTVREVLVQALLDAPMFTVRWRWNVTRALAVPRHRSGRRLAPPLQRMEAENLLASVFPDQLACLEHIVGDREIPDHPLVQQTIEDCLTEAMDIQGLIRVLEGIEQGVIRCVARDLPEPSLLAHEILNAKPYAFLDNAPLEERRTQAVYTRRVLDPQTEPLLGQLDPEAIRRVRAEAWPRVETEDELHDLLLTAGVLEESNMADVGPESDNDSRVHARTVICSARGLFDALVRHGRATRFRVLDAGSERLFWVAAERISLVRAMDSGGQCVPELLLPEHGIGKAAWERSDAIRELVRGQMELMGPITAEALARSVALPEQDISAALRMLEAEGTVLRGHFDGTDLQWCDRVLLARIHRLTVHRLRAEIQPVSIRDFWRFLTHWHCLGAERQVRGIEGLEAVLQQLDGYSIPAGSWEPDILSARVADYDPSWLDRICAAGRVGWGRLIPRQSCEGRTGFAAPVRSTPISLFQRAHLPDWLALAGKIEMPVLAQDTAAVWEVLQTSGALFFSELVKRTRLLGSMVEQALADLVALGLISSDQFEGLRLLLVPAHKRGETHGSRRRTPVPSIEFAGRWSLLDPAQVRETSGEKPNASGREQALERFARVLLRRYGVVFRRLLERESCGANWYEIGRVYRTLEARGEVRGGRFVSGVSGEQFALPEAIEPLRRIRKTAGGQELICVSGADPLNLTGILTAGKRLPSMTNNRLLLCDGIPVAALESGEVIRMPAEIELSDSVIERALKVGALPVSLHLYYR